MQHSALMQAQNSHDHRRYRRRLFIVLLVFVLLLLPLFILVHINIFLSLLPHHLLAPLITIIEESFPSRSCLWSFPFPLPVCPGSKWRQHLPL